MKRSYNFETTKHFLLNDLLSLECIHDTDWCSSLLESKWDEFKNVFILALRLELVLAYQTAGD